MNVKTGIQVAVASLFASNMARAGAMSGLVYGRPDLGPCIAVASANNHYAAIKADGNVVCWGFNDVGQCNVPVNLGPCLAVAANGQANSSGPGFTLALRADGGVVAWGFNGAGQCDVPPALGPCRQIAAGFKNSLVLKSDGALAAWGQAEFGQCSVPPGTFKAIAAGNYHGVAVTISGLIAQWGQCDPVPAGLGICTGASAGLGFTVALKADGTVVRWGSGGSSIPAGLGTCRQISCSDYGVVVIRQDHSIAAWTLNGALVDYSSFGPCLSVAAGYGDDFLAILAPEVDTDIDGVFDSLDNCPTVANPSQADCDSDGTGDACAISSGAPDINGNAIPDSCECIADLFVDRQVNGADLGALLSQWGPASAGTVSDVNRDGNVDGADLGYLLANWGPCPN